jgi:hypothetical protein
MITCVKNLADCQAILLSTSAEICTGADAHTAHSLAKHSAGLHTELIPDRVNILCADSDERNALCARKFKRLALVAFRNICNFAQQFGCNEPAGNMRCNRIGDPVSLQNGAFLAIGWSDSCGTFHDGFV